MCGICGVIHYDGRSVSKDIVESMTDSLKHRGPDSKGVYAEDNVGLGVRRLSVIDLETGNQPVHNEDSSCFIVCNGEIYNHMELRAQLKAKGHSFYTRSDTEAILHSYEEYGSSTPSVLDGMFSFCIFDKVSHSLFLARDRIGEKPLYYMVSRNELVFASEPKAILRYPSYVPRVDPDSLKKYLVFGYVPSPDSLFCGIRKLPPGHFMIVNKSGDLRVQSYYEFRFKEKSSNELGHIERVRQLVSNAVRSRLVSDVPVGILLSGGVDSSLIAALMSQLVQPSSISAFTVGFREKSYDESEYAKAVASFLGLSHKLRLFSEAEVVAHVRDALDLLDEPIADPSIVPTYLVSRIASESVKVVLTGDGGDEVFGGYPKYRVHKFMQFYDRLPVTLKSVLSRLLSNFPERLVGPKVKRVLATLDCTPAERNMLWIAPFLPEELPLLLRMDGGFRLPEALSWNGNEPYSDPVETALKLDLRYALGDLFLCKVDRASMACSLETRAPFLAPALLEFAGALESRHKVSFKDTKILLKRVAMDVLPEVSVLRAKRGFGMPIVSWIRGPLKLTIEKSLTEEKIGLHRFFSYQHVKSLLDDHLAGRRDNSMKIWTLFVFQLWFENWIMRQDR